MGPHYQEGAVNSCLLISKSVSLSCDFSSFYQNSVFCFRYFHSSDLCTKNVKVRALRKKWQEDKNLVDLFAVEYFACSGKLIF